MTGPRRIRFSFFTILAALFAFAPAYAADTLPARISDEAFWKLIVTLSEPDGAFQSENLLSNETDFPRIMASLKRTATPDRAYLGVGPEQNFNYIAALRPKVAFIIDIRRQNMLEHLMYKAIFELSPDRISFMSRLFSRQQPKGLAAGLTAAELFDAYSDQPADNALFEQNRKAIESLLVQTHRFPLSGEDRAHLREVYAAFREFGPLIDYTSRGGGPSGRAFSPSYSRLMTETDGSGREWSYLANEESYRAVRDLEVRNLIVPLTGDFGGPTAIRSVGGYLKEHDAKVSAFYLSNVEGYLFQGGDRQGNANGGAARFYDNVSTLPLDATSTFIRWIPGRQNDDTSIALSPILTTIDDFKAGRFTGADVLRWRGLGRGRGFAGGLLNRPPRPDFQDPASLQTARARAVFPFFAMPVAFLIRWFKFKWREAGERVERRLLHSLAWAAGAYFISSVVFALFHRVIGG